MEVLRAGHSYEMHMLSLPYRNFKQLSSTDQNLLAAVLCHQPPPSIPQKSSSWWQTYASETKKQILALPPPLRAYPSLLTRFANARAKDAARSQSRIFCVVHQNLNRQVVRSTLAWLQREIDVNIPGMLAPLQQSGLLTHSVVQAFMCLRDASAMWLEPTVFEKTFARTVKPKWQRQGDRCAACVMARLGSDAVVVVALRAGMLVRLGHRYSRGTGGRRLHYAECMVNQFDGAETMHRDAENIAGLMVEALQQWKMDRDMSQLVLNAGRSSRSVRMDAVKPVEMPTPRFTTPDWTQSLRGYHSEGVSPLHTENEYEVMGWRQELQRQNDRVRRKHSTSKRSTNEVLVSIIDDYRRTVYEPNFGEHDYLGFKEDMVEEAIDEGWTLSRGQDTVAEERPPLVSPASNYSDEVSNLRLLPTRYVRPAENEEPLFLQVDYSLPAQNPNSPPNRSLGLDEAYLWQTSPNISHGKHAQRYGYQ